MKPFNAVFEELSDLQAGLKKTTNLLWSLKFSLIQVLHEGHAENDFLPRRLTCRQAQLEKEYESYLRQLNSLISTHLDHPFICFHSEDDVKAALHIRRVIRYLQNAFAADLPLGRTLVKLNKALPSYSNTAHSPRIR